MPLLQHLVILLAAGAIEWKFPPNFKFGVATSAYQIEGGWNADGKGPSIWDDLTHNKTHIVKDGSSGDIACDSYHKYEEDIQLVKNLGVDYYRISLAWTRILPDGTTRYINQAGVDYYNNVINTLLKNQIEPVVTLYHWDLPQHFGALGGWTNEIVVSHFAKYARLAFSLFGDRVKIWITINEPNLICKNFKGTVNDPKVDLPLGVVEYLCIHNVLKAHAEAYHIYDREFRAKQKGKISITLDMPWIQANKNISADMEAAERQMQFEIGIYTNPIFNYDYPEIVKKRVAERSKLENFPESRLPKFTYLEKLRIKGTYDFIGVNHYITKYARAIDEPPVSGPNLLLDVGTDSYYDQNWKGGSADWIKVTPWGLRRLLNYIKKRYGNVEIMITENGYADEANVIEDDGRVDYYKSYLNATLAAIVEDDINVTAYMAWSLLDNFEWSYGYTLRFGLYHVNFTDPERKRTPKKSADFYKTVIKSRTVT